MDKLQVIKVKYNGLMCRISAGKSTNGELISFAALEERLRSSFKLAPTSALVLTYSDVDGDVINLSSDQDIVDALLYQQLNPLRVDLAVVENEVSALKPTKVDARVCVESLGVHSAVTAAPPAPSPAAEFFPAEKAPSAPVAPPASVEIEKLADLVGKQLKSVLGVSEEVGRLAKAYEPLLKVAPGKIAEVLDAALKSGLSVSFEPVLDPPAGSACADAIAESKVQKEKDAAELEALVDAAKSVSMGVAVAGAEAAVAAAAAAAIIASSASEAAVATSADAARSASPSPSLVVHSGIICDGCDMNPLVGARYKSLVKHDYDLCEACFRKSNANGADYKCLLQPVFRPRHPHQQFRGAAWTSPCQGAGRTVRCGPPGSPGFGGRSVHHHTPRYVPPCTAPPVQVKLEARFVKDVTVPDNMEVLPGSRFTKIWRMRNTGSYPWPEHTEIVHIGGDMLGECNIVHVQVPSGGALPESEIDVSVDMIAPSKLGRYMSHWRLCAPGGPKFGHRVWALIQVVPKASEAVLEKLPKVVQAAVPAAVGVVKQEDVVPSAPVDPVVAVIAAAAVPEVAETVAEVPAEVVVTEDAPEVKVFPELKVEVVMLAPLVGALPVAPDAPAPAPASSVETSSVGNFSIVDAPVVDVEAKAADSEAGSVDGYVDASTSIEAASAPNGKAMNVAIDAVSADKQAKASAAAARERMFDIEDEVEAETLDQLENMGFEDRELNKAVLAQANGNLFSAIESLMHVAEWDPMLAELEEMGFDDKHLNKRVMFKNGGNVKGAVKELVHFYRVKEGQ